MKCMKNLLEFWNGFLHAEPTAGLMEMVFLIEEKIYREPESVGLGSPF